MATDTSSLERLRAIARRRWHLAVALTVTMVVTYFGFLALVAWAPATLATRVAPGLSLGILLGAAVIVVAWLLTWWYVRWANAVYDPALDAERRRAA